jgi:GST-like protein
VRETNRLYGVLNRRLADCEYLAGDYSIADMAAYPWVVPHEAQGQNLADFAHVKRWFDAIRDRPATRRAYDLAAKFGSGAPMSEEAKKILFGQTAQSRGTT